MAEQQGGLLAFLNSPAGQGLLGAAGAALSGNGNARQNIGRGILGGVGAYGSAQDNALQADQRAYQQEQIKKQRQIDALAPQFLRSGSQNALGTGAAIGDQQGGFVDGQYQPPVKNVGPTLGNASALGSSKPSFDLAGYSQALMGIDPLKGVQIQSALSKDTPFDKVSPKDYTPESVVRFAQSRNFGDLVPVRKREFVNGQAVDPYSVAPGTRIDDFNPNQPFSVIDGKIVPNTGYQSFAINKAKAGAAQNNVSVNTGQKGLDNEFKLRGEFKGEPVYKAHQEMQSAYSQIKQSLSQASPAGDLAGATKIMKLLDPGSVVRESELGMAMAASGLMDRASNYANMVITGQKLTPTQRKEFQTLADALYSESVKSYNAKRAEYERLGGDYGLDASRALGGDASMPEPAAGGWSIKPVSK